MSSNESKACAVLLAEAVEGCGAFLVFAVVYPFVVLAFILALLFAVSGWPITLARIRWLRAAVAWPGAMLSHLQKP